MKIMGNIEFEIKSFLFTKIENTEADRFKNESRFKFRNEKTLVTFNFLFRYLIGQKQEDCFCITDKKSVKEIRRSLYGWLDMCNFRYGGYKNGAPTRGYSICLGINVYVMCIILDLCLANK